MSSTETLSFNELAKLIMNVILEERHISEETTLPRIEATIRSFHTHTKAPNFDKLKLSKKKRADHLKSAMQKQFEANYWRDVVKLFASPDKMKNFYNELTQLLIEAGYITK